MNDNEVLSKAEEILQTSVLDVRNLTGDALNSLIITTVKIDDHWTVQSRYGDDIWLLGGFSNNVMRAARRLDFNCIAPEFRPVIKAIMYRYQLRGRSGSDRPRGVTLKKFFVCLGPFLRFLKLNNITRLNQITPVLCVRYTDECRGYHQTRRNPGKPLKAGGLFDRFSVVEALYELSQYTDDPVPQHPWPETSALAMAGLTGSISGRAPSSKTRLIPDEIFCKIFKSAYEHVERAEALLDIRDSLLAVTSKLEKHEPLKVSSAKAKYLRSINYGGNVRDFNKALINLRTACYIVIASVSGCRNHELSNLKAGAAHKETDDEGNTYHWMQSISEKTKTGKHDWMIPPAAVKALRVMERWAQPYHADIAAAIALRRKINPLDHEIPEATKHLHALFLGKSHTTNLTRTLTLSAWSNNLIQFSRDCCEVEWKLASHQFRRKFANYVAHSKLGDLRYLRDHFAHWSIDMTLGYAIDKNWAQNIDLELDDDINSEIDYIKYKLVDDWFNTTNLAGGYGKSIKTWKKEPHNLAIFKTHNAMVKSISLSTRIRSNGHAWCTADGSQCVGNTKEKSRCPGCNNAVIGAMHAPMYQQLYKNLEALLTNCDLGETGRSRVLRDMRRCRTVLQELGVNFEEPLVEHR